MFQIEKSKRSIGFAQDWIRVSCAPEAIPVWETLFGGLTHTLTAGVLNKNNFCYSALSVILGQIYDPNMWSHIFNIDIKLSSLPFVVPGKTCGMTEGGGWGVMQKPAWATFAHCLA